MSILTDKQIADLCNTSSHKLNNIPSMITPYTPYQVRNSSQNNPVISYGQSSAGYDIRLSLDDGLLVFREHLMGMVDPKGFDKDLLMFSDMKYDPNMLTDSGETWWEIPAHSYALGLSFEYFDIPNDIVGICIGKSTYARCGIIVNVTPLEPGWQGHLVVEIANTTSLPARIYAMEGIAQIMFHKLDAPVDVSYADRLGKYQHQQEIVLARV